MTANPWLVRRPSRPEARLRLVCFGHAGSGPSAYARWGAVSPPEVDLWVVSLPGRETRASERPITRFGALISALAWHLGPALEPPFAFYGHSLGALLAHGLALRLTRAGAPGPVWLGLGACGAPPAPREDPPLSSLPDEALLMALDRRYGGIPAAVRDDPDLRAFVLPPMRADLAVLESWALEPGPPLQMPCRAFTGHADPLIRAPEMRGWEDRVGGPLAWTALEGDHFFNRDPAAALRILADLRSDLATR